MNEKLCQGETDKNGYVILEYLICEAFPVHPVLAPLIHTVLSALFSL
jgi:hypothetical protein